tara:strand:+ start:3773 stop:4138 length:366 start_codon:yes stop_codon:yes gene_type:complete
MNFQKSITTCFQKYAQFNGRASRSEFWFFVLFTTLGSLVGIIIDTMILGFHPDDYGPVYLIFNVVIFIPYFAVGARRLHDRNRSGWWQLLILTLVGIIVLIVWWAQAGKKNKNLHGKSIRL